MGSFWTCLGLGLRGLGMLSDTNRRTAVCYSCLVTLVVCLWVWISFQLQPSLNPSFSQTGFHAKVPWICQPLSVGGPESETWGNLYFLNWSSRAPSGAWIVPLFVFFHFYGQPPTERFHRVLQAIWPVRDQITEVEKSSRDHHFRASRRLWHPLILYGTIPTPICLWTTSWHNSAKSYR